MKLSISPSAARAASFVAIVARIVLDNAVSAPSTHNGAWLCPLLALVLALPWALCADHLRRHAGRRRRPLYAVLAAATALDGADNLCAIARSAGYLALDRVPVRILVLPVSLALLWCLMKNGNAIGYAAMLWMRLAPVLLIVVAVMQLHCLCPEWLQPLLGSGWRAIATGSVRTASHILPCAALLLIADSTEEEKRPGIGLTAMLLIAAALGALLLMMHLMMTPTPSRPTQWINRLDNLLTNGRAPLYLQLPMISAWYAGLLHLLLCEGFGCAALLQRLFPALDGRLCAVLAVAGTGAVALFQNTTMLTDALWPWLYCVAALLAALAVLASLGKGGRKSCA